MKTKTNTKLKTVTIGIPAYNEERNIRKVLIDILEQKSSNYILEKIVVVSDCSNDNTDRLVKELIKRYPIIELDRRKKRSGKINIVNEFFTTNTSDILILFDADITFANNLVIENLIKPFHNPKVSLVGGISKPFPPQSFFERITNTWVKIWDTAKHDRRNKTTLHLLSAAIMAFSKSFASKLKIPESAVVDDQYLYLRAKEMEEVVRFARNANVYYKIPNNLREYLIQSTRYLHFNNYASSHFDESFKKYYFLSKEAKKDALIKSLREDPFFTLLAIALQIVVRISKYFMVEKHEKGTWIMVNSTK